MLFSFLRFSSRALHLVEFYRRNGIDGFCEMVVPTLINISGYTVADFGGDGEFTPPPWQNDLYSSGTFTDSVLSKWGETESWLYHSVRDDERAVQDTTLYADSLKIECLARM